MSRDDQQKKKSDSNQNTQFKLSPLQADPLLIETHLKKDEQQGRREIKRTIASHSFRAIPQTCYATTETVQSLLVSPRHS